MSNLREALEALLKDRESTASNHPNDYVIAPYELRELLAAHPVEPAAELPEPDPQHVNPELFEFLKRTTAAEDDRPMSEEEIDASQAEAQRNFQKWEPVAPAQPQPVDRPLLDREAVQAAVADAMEHKMVMDTPEGPCCDGSHPCSHEPAASCDSCADWGWPCTPVSEATNAVMEAAVPFLQPQPVDREALIQALAGEVRSWPDDASLPHHPGDAKIVQTFARLADAVAALLGGVDESPPVKLTPEQINYAGPTGRELPGEHWNARIIREQKAARVDESGKS